MSDDDWSALWLARLLVLPGDDLEAYFDTLRQIPVLEKQTELDLGLLIWRGRSARARLEQLLDRYGEIAKIPREQAARTLENDAIAGEEARIRLIVCNLRFAAWCARISCGIVPRQGPIREVGPGRFEDDRWGRRSGMMTLVGYADDALPLADRVQAAAIGLIRSANNFSHHAGVRFTSYCGRYIRTELVDAIVAERYRVGRDDRHRARDTAKLVRQRIVLARTAGGDPTEDMLSADTGIGPIATQYRLEESSRYPRYSFEDLGERLRWYDVDEQAWRQIGEVVWDPDAPEGYDFVTTADLLDELEKILDGLTERERMTISMRFGLADGQPRTLDEVGRALGVTRERVRQIESKTMIKLRFPSRSRRVRDYLDPAPDWPWHMPQPARRPTRPRPKITIRSHPEKYDLDRHPWLRAYVRPNR